MELKPGYKQTEVGVIPEDWKLSTIGAYTNWMSGGTPRRSNDEFWNGSIPWISGSTLKSFAISTSDQFLSESGVMAGSKMAPSGAVLLLVRGSALHNEIRAGMVVSPVAFNQDVKALIPLSGLDSRYLTFFILAMESDLLKLVSSAGNSAGVLDTELIKNFKLLLPAKAEQTAIANALSDADALIQSLTRLIAKKRQIKQGAMQTLLNPYENGRLKEGWVVKEVDEIAEVRSGKRLPLGNFLTHKETNHPYIRVTDMYYGGIRLNEIMYVPNDIYPLIKNYRIFKEDIFISVAGTLGLVGKIPCELDGANLTENANRFTNIQCDRDYLLFVLSSPLIQNVIDSEKTLGAQPKLALTRIRKFKIPLPIDKQEQTRIATILADIDTEIAALETKLAKYRHIKQGMMQNLLTGRIRLVKPENNTGAVA